MKHLKSRLNKIGRDLIIAMSIGDGCITKQGYLYINHGAIQKEYCYWKWKLLKNNGVSVGKFREHNAVTGYSKGKKITQYQFQTSVMDFCKVLRRIEYEGGRTKYNIKLLNRLGPQGLAIWIMDDGSLLRRSTLDKTTGKRKYCGFYITISTYCTLEQADTIIKYFNDTWDLKPTKVFDKRIGSYIISFCAREGRKLIEIIKPYMCPHMMYKVIPDKQECDNYMKLLKEETEIVSEGTLNCGNGEH